MTEALPTKAPPKALAFDLFGTAFIRRPMEYGGAPAPDLKYEQKWEYNAQSLTDLADQLGC